jgi:hypothetical protein
MDLDFVELKKILKNVTPYYYVKKFEDKIDDLIKKANKFKFKFDNKNKLIYLVNNMNDMHFSVNELNKSLKYSDGFIIAYDGDKKNGKFVVIRSNINKIHIGDEVLEFDNKKICDIITNLINSYEIHGYNPILTLGDLHKRALDLLLYYTPKIIKLKRNKKIIIINISKLKKKEIKFEPIKNQFYKNIQINDNKTFYFSIKGFNPKVINKNEYLQILEYLKNNIDSYKNIIIDLRKSLGGDGSYVFWLLWAMYGTQMVSYLKNLRNTQSVYKTSPLLAQLFEKEDADFADLIKKGLELNKDYIHVPKNRNKNKIDKPILKNIRFNGNVVVLYDFHCGSACSILLEQLKIIKKEFSMNIIFLGTEDAYDTKFTHPRSLIYKNHKLLIPTKYNKYRARDNYETIRPDYYYYDTTYTFSIPKKLISKLIQKDINIHH